MIRFVMSGLAFAGLMACQPAVPESGSSLYGTQAQQQRDAALAGVPAPAPGSSVVEAVNARRAIPDLTGVFPEMQPLIAHMLEPDPSLRPGRMLDVAAMVENPSLIPPRYTGGTPLPGPVPGAYPGYGTTPPTGTSPGGTGLEGYSAPPHTQTTGIQSPPGLGQARPAPVPSMHDISQSPFGGPTGMPFGSAEQTTAPAMGAARAGALLPLRPRSIRRGQ